METFYVTKYALSKGIIGVEGRVCDRGSMLEAQWPGGLNGRMLFHGKDWHRYFGDAQAFAKKRRDEKLESLEKQIKRLERLTFNDLGKDYRDA